MRLVSRAALAIAGATFIVCSLTAGIAASPMAAKPGSALPGAGADWTGPGGTSDETNFSRLDQIATGNVGKLGLAWSLDLPDEVTLESTPVAVGGTLYFSGSYAKVYAVDGVTGKLKWQFDPQTWKNTPAAMHFSFGANRGVAYENGKVFVAGLDCRLFALDAATGKQLWVTKTVPEGSLNICTGAPRTMNGKVIIGNGGADFGARGFVTALDSATGKQLWRFYTTPGAAPDSSDPAALEAAAKTWGANFLAHNNTPVTGGGGTAWNGITYDAEADRVYVGVGNAGPYDPQKRDPGSNGDNLYTSSIVALDAKTGKYLWHYQENPRDSWDYKATPNIQMATVTVAGAPHKVLLHAPTNGFFYVIDRETGKLLNEPGKTTEINWAKRIDPASGRPDEYPNIRYETGLTKQWPGTVGGHNWQAMSFDPSRNLAFVPIQQIGARFSRNGGSEAAFNVMGLTLEPIVERPGDGHGYLVAWDPITQKMRWQVQNKNLWNGGALSTAGGLVFQGTAEGTFNAYDSASGKRLWQFDGGLGIISAPMSYSVGGKQYVSVLVGYGGTTAAYGKFMDVGWKYGVQTRRLLTFALDARGKLAKMPGPDFVVHALDDPALKLDEGDIATGRALFVQCAACHGAGVHATGTPGPDLRESGIALDLTSFRELLKTGALMERGMPRFEYLTDDQTRAIHAYIRSKARESLGLRKKDDRPEPKPML